MFENPRRGRQARNFTNKCSENSQRFQIVFRTDIFRKLTLGVSAAFTYEENGLRFSNSKQFRFLNKEAFHFRIIFPKKPWDWESCRENRKKKNHESHGRIVSLDHRGSRRASADRKLQKFINFCNLKRLKSTWRQLILPWKVQVKIITSLRSRAEPTNYENVHTWVIHLHIAVPTVTCSLRDA